MKNSMKHLTLILILTAISFSGAAQKKALKEADMLFLQKKYAEAAISYSKIYTKKKDSTLLLKIADSYFSYQNYNQALSHYQRYFKDTTFRSVPQFSNYAVSAEKTGNIRLMVKLFKEIYANTQDISASERVNHYSLYTDSLSYIRSYDLDSNYCCVVVDAKSSIDSLAVPLFYIWDFGNGVTKEGIRVENCFPKAGTYTVVLNIMDSKTGYIKKNDTTLVIDVEEPPLHFKAPSGGRRYFFLDFDATQCSIPAYQITDYIWEMGNGETVLGKNIKYKYLESGEYTVRLTVIAKNIFSKGSELFSAYKTVSIKENYEEPSKTFADDIKQSK